MRRRNSSEAFLFSLSEFAFILLFVLIGLSMLLFVSYTEAQQQVAEQEQHIEELNEEVVFLQDRLEELEGGVVPCWRRPDGTIPRTVGLISIHDENEFSVMDAEGREQAAIELDEEQSLDSEMRPELREIWAEERQYAQENRCYLRVDVENETEGFSVYREVLDVVRSLGIVVAQ